MCYFVAAVGVIFTCTSYLAVQACASQLGLQLGRMGSSLAVAAVPSLHHKL